MSLVINFASSHCLSLSSADALSGPHHLLDKANKPGSFLPTVLDESNMKGLSMISVAIQSIELLSFL